MNQRKKELINTLLRLNKLKRQIESARFAGAMANNNNNNSPRRRTMNNRTRALIQLTHPLREREFILSRNMSPGSVERIKRLRHVVAVQRRAKKAIQKRRENMARARTAVRRVLQPMGAHHALTPAQIARYTMTPTQFARMRRAATVVTRPARNTRSVTMLSRHLMR
jgi:hypothetical protein